MCMHVCRLAMERMSREEAESRLHLLEDQLAELQEELRRVSETSFHSDSLQTVITHTQHDDNTQNKPEPGSNACHPTGSDDSAGRPGRGHHAASASGGDSAPAGAGADRPEGGAEGRGGVPRQRDGDPEGAVQSGHGQPEEHHGRVHTGETQGIREVDASAGNVGPSLTISDCPTSATCHATILKHTTF